jgi:hypothetical protein
MVLEADGRNAARKWLIEINNWRPITIPLNDFYGSRRVALSRLNASPRMRLSMTSLSKSSCAA